MRILALTLSICFSTAVYAEKLSVMLDWFPNPDHAPLIIAKEKGYFKEQGLDVDLISPADPHDPPKLTAAGKIDISISYEPHLMVFVDQGLPLISFGSLISQPLDCMLALKSSGIKTIHDLKGKKIAIGSNSIGNILLNTALKKASIKPTEVELITLNYNMTQALLTHKVDVITDVMRNVEIPELELKGQATVAFYPEDYGIPPYEVLIYITNKHKQHNPSLTKFLVATQKATAYLKAHPEESWSLFIKAYPEANNALNKRSWSVTIPYFSEHPSTFNKQAWLTFAKFMQENGLIKEAQSISNYHTSMQ